MAVNYYDQFQPLTYNPMSLQEMLIGPQMMQQKHDEAQALLDQESLFDVPALTVDQPGVQEWMDKYKGNINELADNLLRSGYNKDLARKARRILQEKQEATSSRGYLGKANAAYQTYLKNVEDEKKRLEKGEINRDQFQRGLAIALQRYNQAGGASKNASFDPWYSTKAIDLQDLVSKYGKEITPQTIAQDLGYKYDPTTGIITDSSNKTVTISPQRISQVIQSRIMSNPEAMAYLKEREQLGLSDGVMNELNRLGAEGALTFARNDSETKTSYDFGLFKKFQQGVFESNQLNADAQTKILSMPFMPLDDLSEVARIGKPQFGSDNNPYWDAVTDPGNLAYGDPGSAMTLVGDYRGTKIINPIENNEIIKYANEQIDKEWEYLRKFYPNISREDVLKYEKDYAKNNKTTAAFKFVPQAMYEDKYKQDLEDIKNGSLPGSLQDYYIEGKNLEKQKDFHKAVGFEPKKNPVVNVHSAFAPNGASAFFVTMKDGKQYQVIRKPQESDKAKFETANALMDKYYDNSRGVTTFKDPVTGLPIKMEKFVGPQGMQAFVTMSVPVFNNQGQLIGTEAEKTLPFNTAIEKLTSLVLEQKYVNKYKESRPSHGQ